MTDARPTPRASTRHVALAGRRQAPGADAARRAAGAVPAQERATSARPAQARSARPKPARRNVGRRRVASRSGRFLAVAQALVNAIGAKRLLGACALVIALVIGVNAIGALRGNPEPTTHHAQIAATSEIGIPATPKSLWKAGTVPYLYQTDKQWASEPYAGGTIEENGCGPTSLCMVYIARTGDASMSPKEMADYSTQNGYYVDGMTKWSFMDQGARALGLSPSGVVISADAVTEALQNGKILIVSVGKGDFTDNGHFMVVTGLDDNGQLIIHDPNSAVNSLKRWDIDRVLSQTVSIWAY